MNFKLLAFKSKLKILRIAFDLRKDGKHYTDPKNGVYDMLMELKMVHIDREEKLKMLDQAKLGCLLEAGQTKNEAVRVKLLEMADEKQNQGNAIHPDLVPRVKSLILELIIDQQIQDGPENVEAFLDSVENKIEEHFNETAQ